MSSQTEKIGLIKPTEAERALVSVINGNMDIIDEEIGKRGKTVNGIEADENGNYEIDEVPFARQIVTDDSQQSSGEYIARTTGGDASLSDGEAKLIRILGRSEHTGEVAESLEMTLNAVPREEGEEQISAEIDRDTFVEYVAASGTITLSYTNAWSANPALYGVTVTGTPLSGDQIIIVYVKADRGLITNSNPTSLTSTGWNLYNNTLGYARVLKYSDVYGFLIGGTYSAVQFSETIAGSKTTISPTGGYFTVPSDGYVWVTGGNATDTYILMTWSDWGDGPDGSWEAYTESTIDLTTAVANFPNGMMQVGSVRDELDVEFGHAISRIERIAYSDENLADVIASGREYDADENYIYVVRETPVTYDISVSKSYTASDHGMEFIGSTSVPVFVQVIYGENLVDKLRTDIPNRIAGLETNVANLADGLAIVANGNTHAAIASGQWVYVRNHSSLAEGLYKATAAISANATLSTSNLTADAKGGLNALKSDVDTLNNNLTGSLVRQTTKITSNNANYIRIGRMVVLSIDFDVASALESNSLAFYTVPADIKPASDISALYAQIDRNGTEYTDKASYIKLRSDGEIRQSLSSSWSSGYVRALFVYYV